MDPNENIRRQRKLAREILAHPTTYTSTDSEDPSARYNVIDSATELAELAQALDSWLAGGGFKPSSWTVMGTAAEALWRTGRRD